MSNSPHIAERHPNRTWARLRRNRRALFGMIVIGILLFTALFAPLIAGGLPIVCRYEGTYRFPALIETVRRIPVVGNWIKQSPPFSHAGFDARAALSDEDPAIWPLIPYSPLKISEHALTPPSAEHWLGTDESGRDIASRMIHGAVVSVQVGIVSMTIAAFIGIAVGAVAGYFGGWIDILVSRLIEVVICFPDFFLILAVMAWLDPGIGNVMVVIGLTRWTSIARYTRGEFIRLNQQDFALAAKALGAGPLRIMLRHLLPNALAPVLVTITFGVATAVLLEAGLSWLGFGVQAPQPSWGNILRTAYTHLRDAPHMVYPPCAAIFITVLVYNLVGDALRDALDPQAADHHRERSAR